MWLVDIMELAEEAPVRPLILLFNISLRSLKRNHGQVLCSFLGEAIIKFHAAVVVATAVSTVRV